MRIVKGKDEKETTVIFIYRDKLPPETKAALKEIEQILGLKPGADEIKVSYGIIPETDQELAMQTRSMLQIMIELATQIDVPSEHVKDGRTIPTLIQPDSTERKFGQFIDIHTDKDQPASAFVSVK